MSIIFYHHESGSTCSQKVKLCLHYKELRYESINIDLAQRQNQDPAYLKINRHGLVPAISDNGNIIVESNLINEYLDRVYPGKPLMPQDSLDLYQMQYLCKRQEYINEQCLRYLSYQHSGRVSILSEEEIQNHPQLDRRRFLKKLKRGISDHEVSEIEDYLLNELRNLNFILQSNKWLCGKSYSLADISWTAAIYRFEQLGKIKLLHDNKFHYLQKWYEGVKGMNNFCGYGF